MGITSTTGTSSLSSENATKRIAIVNTWTYNDLSSGELAGTVKIRYQYSNHLGSASLELNDVGEFVSYQEYFPFGETAYTYGTVSTEYRFTGKERDEFTGLYYFGARYYAPWMFRWMNPDPSGPVDGLNVFVYVSNQPIVMVDPDGRRELNWFEKAAVNLFSSPNNKHIMTSAAKMQKQISYEKSARTRIFIGIGLSMMTRSAKTATRQAVNMVTAVPSFIIGTQVSILSNHVEGLETPINLVMPFRANTAADFLRQNMYPSLQQNSGYKWGRVWGDVVSTLQSGVEMGGGMGLMTGSISLTGASGGATSPVTVPTAVAGGALLTYGGAVYTASTKNLMNNLAALSSSNNSYSSGSSNSDSGEGTSSSGGSGGGQKWDGEIGEEAISHLKEGKGFKRARGLKGGHNEKGFFDYFRQQGRRVEVYRETVHPDFPGLKELDYRVGQGDPRGNGFLHELGTSEYGKTVYDPNIYSDEQIIQWGAEALEGSTITHNNYIRGTASNGMKFEGFLADNLKDVKSFYPVFDFSKP